MKAISCQFVGSFYKLEQIPQDKRPQIAFAGRSNVGKSSLLNKLTGQKKLAKVSNTPGKTRALNFFIVNDKFYFVDLPGYGYAKVSKQEKDSWNKMMENYLDKSDNLIGLFLLLDCRREVNQDDLEMIKWLHHKQLPGIAVVTKTDKLTRDKINRKLKELKTIYDIPAIPFSVVDGTGKNELLSAVFNLLEEKN